MQQGCLCEDVLGWAKTALKQWHRVHARHCMCDIVCTEYWRGSSGIKCVGMASWHRMVLLQDGCSIIFHQLSIRSIL